MDAPADPHASALADHLHSDACDYRLTTLDFPTPIFDEFLLDGCQRGQYERCLNSQPASAMVSWCFEYILSF